MSKRDIQELTLEKLLNKKIFPMRSDENSYLVVTCNNLHKKPLKNFEIEDLRIMIGQSIGLQFLVPMAIKELEKNILAEGDFYEGDLLNSVMYSDFNYWKNDKDNHKKVVQLFENNLDRIFEFDTSENIKNGLIDSFEKFKAIHE